MTRDDFETLVSDALVGLPREFQEKLDNVVVVVEDLPTWEQAKKLNLHPGKTLFGLYEGVPKTRRGAGYTMIAPDKITIFQRPIEYFFQSEDMIRAKVRETVLHEVGHHFGLTETQIQKALRN